MTDRETLIAMFQRAGVRWAEDLTAKSPPHAHSAIRVTESTLSPANEGYSFFFTVFTFDATGTLIWMGAFE